MGLSLTDPGTPTDGRITLRELADGLSNPATLIGSPTVPAGVDFVLPVSVSPALPGLTLDPSAKITANWASPDLVAGSPRVQFDYPNATSLSDAASLAFSDVTASLNSVANYLGSVEGLSYLGQKVIGLNLSPSDLVAMTAAFRSAARPWRPTPRAWPARSRSRGWPLCSRTPGCRGDGLGRWHAVLKLVFIDSSRRRPRCRGASGPWRSTARPWAT